MTSASGTVVRQVCRAVEAGRGEEGDQGGGQRRIVVHGSKKTEFYAKNIFELFMDDGAWTTNSDHRQIRPNQSNI